jgi:hypothetical protein
MKSWNGRSGRILSRDLAREMMSPQLGQMALGMHTRGEGESFSIQQAGGGVGSQARVVGYPGRCQGAVLLINTDRGRRVVAETLAAVGQEYSWPDLPLRVAKKAVSHDGLGALAGRYAYDAAPASTVTVGAAGGDLLMQFGEGSPFAPVFVGGTIFVWPGSALEMTFDEPVADAAPGLTLGTAGFYGSHLSRVEDVD